jgi:hypothetical protein
MRIRNSADGFRKNRFGIRTTTDSPFRELGVLATEAGPAYR